MKAAARKLLVVFAVTICLCLNLAQTISAHEMPSSAVSLNFEEKRVTAELILPIDRLEVAFGKRLTDSPSEVIDSYREELEAYFIQHVRPVSPEGEDWSVSVIGMSLQLNVEPYDLIVQLLLVPPDSAPLNRFTLNYDVIINQLITHKAFVSVSSDWNNGVTASAPLLLGTLRADVTSIEINQSGGSWWHGFANLTRLGISHIAEGTDHLMFLLVLLLPAPLLAKRKRWTEFGGIRHSVTQLFKVATAFTIGHSLTLIAGALEWIPGSSRWVETLIAVSILVSAVHAIRPIFPGRESLIAVGFGLIHGMAFATLIEEIGISPWRLASSLLGFNIGIELMQLAVIAMTMPWLLLMSVTRVYRYIRLIGAGIAIVASIGWILERLNQETNPVASAVNAATPYAGWLIAALAAIAIIVRLMPTNRSKIV